MSRVHRALHRMRPPRQAVAAAIAVAAVLGTVTPAAAERRCTLDRIDGSEAQIWSDGAWRAAVPGPLPAGEVKLTTGAATRLGVSCSDGIRVTLAPATELNVEALAAPDGRSDSVILQLIDGLIGLVAPERSFRRFDVRTPLAIASVRSTEWVVGHAADASEVFVREGSVTVAGGGARATLGPGEGIDIAAAGGASDVKRWGAPRVAGLTERLGPAW